MRLTLPWRGRFRQRVQAGRVGIRSIAVSAAVATAPVAALAAASPPALGAQDVPPQQLAPPNARFARAFTHVAAVRELPGGQLIVVDPGEVAVVILDPADPGADGRILGRSGSGPGEYLFPDGLMPLPGDSMAVVDPGNMRILKIAPSGALADVLVAGDAERGLEGIPSFADTFGGFYAQGPSVNLLTGVSLPGFADSVAIERWTVGSRRRDTVAFISLERFPRRTSPTGPNPPFSTTTLWTVGANGRTAVIHPDPYRVTLVQRSGELREGATVPYERVRLTDKHKQLWREKQQEPMPTAMRVRGGSGTAWSMMRLPPAREPEDWPRYLPPLAGLAVFAPDGALWVQRTTPAADPLLFDVFDELGRVAGRVQLPLGARLVGFGRESLYLVHRDELDLEYVHRHALPNL